MFLMLKVDVKSSFKVLLLNNAFFFIYSSNRFRNRVKTLKKDLEVSSNFKVQAI
jgi:hypothetical protein